MKRALSAIAIAFLLIAGCSSDKQAAPPQSDVPPPLVPAMPLPDNAVDNAVAKLDGLADELMKKSGIPGLAVAVVHGGKTVYAKGFGVKDVRGGDKIDPDTVIEFPEGLIGLGGSRYALLARDPETPFLWLQSMEDRELALPVTNPHAFFSDFAVDLTDEEARSFPRNPAVANSGMNWL